MWLAIIIAVIGGIGSVLAVLQSRAAVKSAKENTIYRVDAGAYERAQEIYEGSIQEMRAQLSDLRAENQKLRLRVTELESTLISMKQNLREL